MEEGLTCARRPGQARSHAATVACAASALAPAANANAAVALSAAPLEFAVVIAPILHSTRNYTASSEVCKLILSLRSLAAAPRFLGVQSRDSKDHGPSAGRERPLARVSERRARHCFRSLGPHRGRVGRDECGGEMGLQPLFGGRQEIGEEGARFDVID